MTIKVGDKIPEGKFRIITADAAMTTPAAIRPPF